MPVAYSSSISSQIVISSGEPETSDHYSLVNETSDTVAAMGDAAGQSQGGTAVSAAVDATAFGTDTLAVVEGEVSIIDSGPATVTNVNLEALAAAQSASDFAFASTYIEATHTGGTGSYISIGHQYASLEIENGQTTAISSSSLALVVIELDENGFSVTQTAPDPDSGLETDVSPAAFVPGETCGCADETGPAFDFDINGNLATFGVAVLAVDENSYTDLVVDAFVLDDAMSSVTIFITAAID